MIGGEISVTTLVFILDYFQEKLMTKFFKNPKRVQFGLFFLKSGQKLIFLEKRSLSIFRCSNYLHHAKNQKKTNKPFLRKMLK